MTFCGVDLQLVIVKEPLSGETLEVNEIACLAKPYHSRNTKLTQTFTIKKNCFPFDLDMTLTLSDLEPSDNSSI